MDQFTGIHAVREALEAGSTFDRILIAKGRQDSRVEEIVQLARERGVSVRFEDRGQLDRLANTRDHQGVVAIAAARAATTLEDILQRAQSVQRTGGPNRAARWRGRSPQSGRCDSHRAGCGGSWRDHSRTPRGWLDGYGCARVRGSSGASSCCEGNEPRAFDGRIKGSRLLAGWSRRSRSEIPTPKWTTLRLPES